MLCHSCGAPMTLHRERGYFHCEYCGSFHFPDETVEGIRLLGPAPEKLPCPICRDNLHLALIDDVYHGHQCPTCRGLWLPTSVFRDVVQRRRAAATDPPHPPAPRDPGELKRRLRCPSCGQILDTHPYFGPGNIIIDTCNACHALWLDVRELARVVNAPGSDRGSDHRADRRPPLRPLYTPPSLDLDSDDEPSLFEMIGSLFR